MNTQPQRADRSPGPRTHASLLLLACAAALAVGCARHRTVDQDDASIAPYGDHPARPEPGTTGPRPRPGTPLQRLNDEIVIAGQLFHTGAPVVLWTDPGGYDAYRTEYRFRPFEQRDWSPEGPVKEPQRYNLRRRGRTQDELEQVRGGGWTLDLLRQQVDRFVLHYDVCGTSRQCFNILQDHRGLSVHFMLDIDGTIYQTLDVKERAWHASANNDRSIGIEIASIGAYPPGDDTLDKWYSTDPASGLPRITLPQWLGDGGVRTPGFVGTPARPERITGRIHGATYEMYDLTEQQYDSLIRLTAALCAVLPAIECDYPRDASGQLIATILPDDMAGDEPGQGFRGILGHWHVSPGKRDPGPALDWDRLITGSRALLNLEPTPDRSTPALAG